MSKHQGRVSRRAFVAAGAGAAVFGFNRLAAGAESDSGKMVTQLAKFKINMEKETEAVQALKDLAAAVEKNEPNVLIYICHRVSKKPAELVFFEVYKDPESLAAHMKTPHFAKLTKSFATLFRLPLEVTRLDRLAGFSR